MTFTYKDYILKEDANDLFDLYVKVEMVAQKDTKDRKKGEKYIAEKLLGYSFTMPSAMKRIARNLISRKKGTAEIKQYRKQLLAIMQDIDENLKELK